MKKKMSLQMKLIFILLIAAIIPLTAISIISLFNATRSLGDAEQHKLEAVRDIKKTQIEEYFHDIKSELVVLAQTMDIRNAVSNLIQYHTEMGIQGDENFDNTGKHETLTRTYQEIHNTIHPFIGDFIEGFGHSDVLIICAAHGHVMYTHAKKNDFTENLTYGKYRQSILAEIWKDIVNFEGFHISDIAKYAPAGGKPSMFLGQPIKINGVAKATLVIEISPKHINDIMHEAAGMGKTGETYLVGDDYYMRSDSRFDYHGEHKDILNTKVETSMSKDALAGNTDVTSGINFGGNTVISAYAPIKVDERQWALMAEINQEEALAAVTSLITLTIIIAAIVIAIFAITGILFARSISVPINQFTETLLNSSGQIALASNQLSSSSQEIANGATEQASSIEETTSSMEELASMVKQNAGNSKEASILSDKAREATESGFNKMEQMVDSMSEINKSSNEIRKIIDVIDNIAFQTNILALNAAVEAARAGEAGMGFAVVADEVKNLANRSAEAAKETAGLIEESIKRTEGGLAISNELSTGFETILTNIQKVAEMSKEVEAASRQQDTGINQVNKAIVQLDEVVQSNASSSEEAASSAEEMASQADTLREIVGQLSTLVTGKTKTSKNLREYKQIEHKTTGIDLHRAQSTQAATPKEIKHKEVSPEKLIPFEEDEEFSDID